MREKYIPDRNDLIWLDFEPTKGREIGKYRPALVLSSKQYNKQMGLIICCPISTHIRGKATEVPVKNLEQPSVVVTRIISTYSWKQRKVKFIKKAEAGILESVLQRIIPLIGGEKLFLRTLQQ